MCWVLASIGLKFKELGDWSPPFLTAVFGMVGDCRPCTSAVTYSTDQRLTCLQEPILHSSAGFGRRAAGPCCGPAVPSAAAPPLRWCLSRGAKGGCRDCGELSVPNLKSPLCPSSCCMTAPFKPRLLVSHLSLWTLRFTLVCIKLHLLAESPKRCKSSGIRVYCARSRGRRRASDSWERKNLFLLQISSDLGYEKTSEGVFFPFVFT